MIGPKKFLTGMILASTCLAAPVVMSAQPDVPFPTATVETVEKNLPEEQRVRLGPAPGFAGYYLAGRHAQMMNDWERARQYLDLVAAKHPTNLTLRRRAMVVAMGSGHLDMAARHAQAILSVAPQDTLSRLFVGVKALQEENYDQALDAFKDMPEGGMARFAAPLLKTWAQAAEGEYDVSQLRPDALNAYHATLASQYLKRNEETNLFLDRVHEEMGDNVSLKLGDAYLIQGNKDTAREIYQKLRRTAGPNAALQKRLSYIEQNRDGLPFDIPTTPREGLGLALLDMARILYAQNSIDSARVFGQMAGKFRPGDEETHILMAQLYMDSGLTDQAVEEYETIAADSPYYNQVQLEIAAILEEAGQQDRAIGQLTEFYEETGNREAQIILGDLYRQNNDFEAALNAYQTAADSFDGDIPANYWHLLYARGMVHEQLDNWDRAETDLQAALDFRPEDPYILNHLAYSWTDRGIKLDKALKYLEKASNLRPTDGHIKDSLGWVLYKLGRYEEAITPLEQAITYLPYDSVVNDHLGDAYWQVGRHREARFQWKRAINNVDNPEQRTAFIEHIEQKMLSGVKSAHVRAANSDINQTRVE